MLLISIILFKNICLKICCTSQVRMPYLQKHTFYVNATPVSALGTSNYEMVRFKCVSVIKVYWIDRNRTVLGRIILFIQKLKLLTYFYS